MKVLFDHPWPFSLAHGGLQIQIEQTKAALEASGVGVEYIRWWDDRQEGDLIHYFGRPSGRYVEVAQEKGCKVVVADLLGGLGARPALARAFQLGLMSLCRGLFPNEFLLRLGWDAFRKADACVALTPWEAQLMVQMFSARREKVHVIPNGVEAVFFESKDVPRGPWLICTASILPVKRVLELAQAAVVAHTPLWIVGKPFDPSATYGREFLEFARNHPDTIRYQGPIYDRSDLACSYRSARGFVLLSRWETLSISALEAAACQCPLLLSDLPWARSTFGDDATYCPITSVQATASRLREFYDRAPNSPPASVRPRSWLEVAQQLACLYTTLLKG